jgi:adenylate cyclase
MQAGTAAAHFFIGRYTEALSWAEAAIQTQPAYIPSTAIAAAAAALSGNQASAAKAMARLCQIDPELRLANLKDVFPIRRPEDFERLAEGLRRARLPD